MTSILWLGDVTAGQQVQVYVGQTLQHSISLGSSGNSGKTRENARQTSARAPTEGDAPTASAIASASKGLRPRRAKADATATAEGA